jgi:FkbM family methyltransferase
MNVLFYCGIHNLVNFSRIRPFYDVCYGFDANPEIVERARDIYANDPNVKIIYGALTEKGGEETEFFITTDWTPASSLGQPNPDFVHMKTGLLQAQKKIRVPTINLHDFCATNKISHVDTLVTDLQGIDLTVLKTMTEFIRNGNIREIQCEVEPDHTPQRYLGIPSGKLSEFSQLLSNYYDVLWTDPPGTPEGAWEMDVRWRVKGGQPLDGIEFVMENDLLVAKVPPAASLSSYSQYREDLVIDALFKHKPDGFYVDIGANDPDVLSNTKLFYGRGWRGINVEPEPNLHAKLCAQRTRDINIKAGVGPKPGVMTFYRMSADTLSSFNKRAALQAGLLYGATLLSEVQIQVRTLTDILASHLKGMKIDLMSVDAEGYDLAVLESNDWSRFRPSVIIVEINVSGNDIVSFLQKQDYVLIFDNTTNGVFVAKEFSATIDDHIKKDLCILEKNHGLRTLLPRDGGKDNLYINHVYGHQSANSTKAFKRGNVTIICTHLPVEGCDHYVYTNAFSYRGRRPGLNILLMLEPSVVLPGEYSERVWQHFDHIFGLFDSLTDRDAKYHKILFPRADISGANPVTEIQSHRESLYPLTGRKHAICMIGSNRSSHVTYELYSKRVEAARWFAEHSKIPFDVYGTPFALPNYQGPCPVSQKLSKMKEYRFNLCFENTNDPILSAGYVTEKILDCMESRTIPIYLGAPNIGDYIPEDCFIDFRKYADYADLEKYLQIMTDQDYQRYIAAIDAFVTSGNLMKYAEAPLYNKLAMLCADASGMKIERLFAGANSWELCKALPPTARQWQFVQSPTMWTWKHLSSAQAPLLENGKVPGRRQSAKTQNAEASDGRNAKSFLIGKKPSIKIFAAGVKYFSGNARYGYDYGWWNMFDALQRLDNVRMQFFDYATDAQVRGVAGMSERFEEIISKEKPDLLFYYPVDGCAGILPASMKNITASMDTQTVIWMNHPSASSCEEARLWSSCADYIITTSEFGCQKDQEAGIGSKIIQSQWAFNPFTYAAYPYPKNRGMSFIGSARGDRSDLLDTMKQSGLSVDAFGNGWHEDSYISFYDMVKIFGQSKINLDLGHSDAVATGQIGRRIFEITGSRGFVITHPAGCLEKYYKPGTEAISASSPEELIDKCNYYLSHDQERETIALRGYERTMKDHTWFHRFRDIFKQIGFTVIANTAPTTGRASIPVKSSVIAPLSVAANDIVPSVDVQDKCIETTINVMAYNQLEYTRKCVESILHYTKEPFELLLTDNGSTDGTSEYFNAVKNYRPHTRIIRNFQNRIAETAINHSTSMARGTYFVFVSNDTLVHEGWLDNLIRHLESAPDVGWVGPRSNSISGPQLEPANYDSAESFHTFAAERSNLFRGKCFPVDRLAGMLVITKKKYFERIGGADPYLPANGRDGGYGFSDDDISLRFRLAGYRLLVADDVYIHHFGSVSAKQYRPDLFGAPQNMNRDKFINKIRKNSRITIGADGRMTLLPYSLDDAIPIDESTVIRTPQVCFVETKGDASNTPDAKSRYSAVAHIYNGDIVEHQGETIQSLILKILDHKHYDFLVLIDSCMAPSPEVVSALTDTALCYPDVAVMVPIGSYAPTTHAHRAENGKAVEIIQYADMSFCVINVKLIRPFIQGMTHTGNDGEFLWFLQRRIRGESFFIAKANNITADCDVPCSSHPYDSYPLPEIRVQDNKYAEAIAVYKDDLIKDPSFVESLCQLAYIAKEQHQSSEAIQYAQDALQIDPHHIQSLLLLSRIFLDQGDLKRAQSFVSQANMKQPGNPDVQKVVELYESKLKGRAGLFQADAVKEIPSLIRPDFTEGLTSIIIPVQSVHFNECVASIGKYTGEPHEVILLDHGATPKLKKQIVKALKENPNYKAAKIDRKSNFAQSLNVGINESSGEYIVLLFDDVVVGEDWLTDMRACLHNGTNIGVVGAMSDNVSSLQRAEGIDFKSVEERASFRERNRHRRIQSRYLDGFCMLFRRDLLIRIGLFDEIFNLDKHMFDDFCVRAVLEGCNNVIAGGAFVHNGGGLNRMLSRDKTIFDEKWIGLDASTDLAEKVLTVNSIETARSQYHKGSIDGAVMTLIARIGFSPDEKRLYYRLAEILLAENKYQEALDALKGLSAAEEDAEYYALLGYGNEGLGLYNAADGFADKALAVDGKSSPALNLKGILAYRKDDAGKAAEYFMRAIEADPGYGDPYTNIGMLRWKTRQKQEAVDLFEKGFILSPDKGDLITSYYQAISSLELYERAEPIFREAKTGYPENKRILFLLIDILLKQDKFQEAMKEVEKAMVHFGMDEGILAAALEIRRRIGAKTIAVTDRSATAAPTLSVCMIVKDEERHMANCLYSLSPVADEMIVVDTGSADSTKRIAEAFGAQVYDFEWVNDFAVARNHSLSKAKGDWILVMDADEVISFEDHDPLKKLIGKKDRISYILTTRNYVARTAGDGWVCNDNSYIHEQAGRGWYPSAKVRLFPNNDKIRFEQPIHELVEYSLTRIGMGWQESGIPVHHYGELDAEKATIKDAQYYELGLQKMRESGGDFRSVWELAVQSAELGKTEESIELWHKVLEFKQREATAYFNLANHYLQLKNFEESYACSRKAYALDPLDQSAVLSYAMSEFLAGDINKAISALEGFLKGSDSQISLVGLLAVSYLVSGEKDRALKYLRGMVRKKYDCVYYLNDLSQALIRAGNLDRAITLLTAAVEINFCDQKTSALLAQCEAGAGNH